MSALIVYCLHSDSWLVQLQHNYYQFSTVVTYTAVYGEDEWQFTWFTNWYSMTNWCSMTNVCTRLNKFIQSSAQPSHACMHDHVHLIRLPNMRAYSYLIYILAHAKQHCTSGYTHQHTSEFLSQTVLLNENCTPIQVKIWYQIEY